MTVQALNGRTHLVIPDTQVKPGVPLDHLWWIGQYIVDKRPDVVVHLGDHWDMSSLSSYDKGKRKAEGRRYEDDVAAGNEGMAVLMGPILAHDAHLPASLQLIQLIEWELLRGNHEERILRATNDAAELEGALSYDDLESPGWTVHDFLEVVAIDGVHYSHFFANPMTGRPLGGTSMDARLKSVGASFTMGHQQTLMVGRREVAGGRVQRGLVAGACYLHHEDYKGPQGNHHWRGILRCHAVHDGDYDLMEISLDSLCRRYEGVPLAEFTPRLIASGAHRED